MCAWACKCECYTSLCVQVWVLHRDFVFTDIKAGVLQAYNSYLILQCWVETRHWWSLHQGSTLPPNLWLTSPNLFHSKLQGLASHVSNVLAYPSGKCMPFLSVKTTPKFHQNRSSIVFIMGLFFSCGQHLFSCVKGAVLHSLPCTDLREHPPKPAYTIYQQPHLVSCYAFFSLAVACPDKKSLHL